MSTIRDFDNAPVGATATSPNGNIAVKTGRKVFEWSLFDPRGVRLDNHPSEQLVLYTLNPTAPTNSREALDMAWDLAHDVREGQVIPEGTKYLARHSEPIQEFTATDDIEIVSWLVGAVRSHEPLPDPEPDWLKAPAVKARVKGYPVLFTWVPVDGPRHHRWYSPVKGQGETYDWQDLCDVTPLYPEEDNEGMYVTGPVNIQLKDRNGQTVWEI